MKKVLVSLMLVFTLLTSSICCVNAAVGDVEWFKGKFESTNTALNANVEEIEAPVTIKVKLGSEADSAYAASLRTTTGSVVDLIAELDMSNVKTMIATAPTVMGANFDAVKGYALDGKFVIKTNWAGILEVTEGSPLATGSLEGFKFDDAAVSDIFEEVTARSFEEDEEGKVVGVTAVIDIKDGKTIADVLALPDKITLEHKGFKVIGFGTVGGSFVEDEPKEDYTYTGVVFSDTDTRYVDYTFPVTGATLEKKQSSYGGGGVASYIVRFDTDDGSSVANVSITQNGTVKEPAAPTKEGYIFDGWYADEALTTPYDFSAKVTKSFTLYAKWVEDENYVKPDDGDKPFIPDDLDGENHFAYVQGYPDGTVRPMANITRAEVATIFYRLLKESVRTTNVTTENKFDDVTVDDWYNTEVSTMAALGILNGRTENTFAPDEYITRAEFAAIAARFDKATVENGASFADVTGHWAENEIAKAAARKWVTGYEDNTFRPENNITRAEAITLINRVLARVPETTEDLLDGMKVWTDNADASAWYYLAIQEATNAHSFNYKDATYEKWTELN